MCECVSICDIAVVSLCRVEWVQFGIRGTLVRLWAETPFIISKSHSWHFSFTFPLPASLPLLEFEFSVESWGSCPSLSFCLPQLVYYSDFFFRAILYCNFSTQFNRETPSSSYAWLNHKYSYAQHTLAQTYSVIKLFQGQSGGLAERGEEEKVSDNATSKLLQTRSFARSFRWIKATSGLFVPHQTPFSSHTESSLGPNVSQDTPNSQHQMENNPSSRVSGHHKFTLGNESSL